VVVGGLVLLVVLRAYLAIPAVVIRLIARVHVNEILMMIGYVHPQKWSAGVIINHPVVRRTVNHPEVVVEEGLGVRVQ